MTELDDLLGAVRKASRGDRILFRDQVAAFGRGAIRPLRDWVSDPELGAFAVRVLEKIAEQPADRPEVVEALRAVDPATVPAPVAGDIADALGRLSPRTGMHRAKSAAPAQWVGYVTASPLERRFHDDMLDVFRLAGQATRKQRPDGTTERGYWASYFLRAVRHHGGLPYAHQLLRMEGTTDGFARLTEERRLDLTMEALVLRPEYVPLFSEKERQVAASRLASAGWSPTTRLD